MTDSLYTNGVIAVKEKDLLKDKVFRLCEMKAEDAFRMLTESGFGSGAEEDGFEALAVKEERALDEFIRTYAPSAAYAEYLLAPRDFHNAKALLKAEYLHTDAEKMLAPEGLYSVSEMAVKIKNGDYGAFYPELASALQEAAEGLKEESGVSGADIGGIFECALYRRLVSACKRSKTLKNMIAQKADMTNLLTAFRSAERAYAEKMYVEGGKLKPSDLACVFGKDDEKAERTFRGTPYEQFCAACFLARSEGKPFTEAETMLGSFEADYFAARKYELEGKLPFLYYVLRRRNEIKNVRMIFVCLAAGMPEQDIKKRLRAV